MLNGSFLDTTFQVGFQPNDTATLSIEDVKPTGLGEYILKTHNTNADNMLTVEKTAPAGTTSGLMVNEGTRAVTVEEAFLKLEFLLLVPASRSNAFELFADTYSGGTYTLTGDDAAHSKLLLMAPLHQQLCSNTLLVGIMRKCACSHIYPR